jgi:hypothetical protein
MTRERVTLLLLFLLCATGALAQTPTLEVTPSPIIFGCTLGGEDSTRTFVVRNTGATDVTIQEFLAPAEFTAPSTRDVIVPAGGQIEEVLHFTPLSAGPASPSGSLILRTADGDLLVPIAGEIGAEPTIGVSLSRLDFGDVTVGSIVELCITVSNPSCREIEVFSAAVSHPAFSITRVFPTPRILGPFEQHPVCVTFSPTTPGDVVDELVFEGALGKRAVVRLFGRGVRSEISVEPAAVNFGPIEVGSSSAEIVVEIVNRGQQSATIAPGLAVSGANPGDFVVTSAPLPFDVGPGERVPLRLSFTPTALGTRTAEIVLNNSSDIDPVITLEGRGVLFDVVVTPDSVDMGDVFVGQSRMALDTVLVLNRGSEAVTITGTTIEGLDAPAFERYGFVVARLNPGDSYVLDIEFKPYAPRVFNADLVITLETGATFRIPLRGRGLDTSAARPRTITGDTVQARVGERRLLRFAIDPPLGGSDTARRVIVRLRLDPFALYPHRVIADGVTATRSYSADGIVEITLSSPEAVALDHFDLEIEGLFTGRPLNMVTVDSVDLGDPRITVSSSPGVVRLEGCDVVMEDTLLRPVQIVALVPNPAVANCTMRYRAPDGAILRISTTDGIMLSSRSIPATGDGDGSYELPIDELATGAYYIKLVDVRSTDWRLLEVTR